MTTPRRVIRLPNTPSCSFAYEGSPDVPEGVSLDEYRHLDSQTLDRLRMVQPYSADARRALVHWRESVRAGTTKGRRRFSRRTASRLARRALLA